MKLILNLSEPTAFYANDVLVPLLKKMNRVFDELGNEYERAFKVAYDKLEADKVKVTEFPLLEIE